MFYPVLSAFLSRTDLDRLNAAALRKARWCGITDQDITVVDLIDRSDRRLFYSTRLKAMTHWPETGACFWRLFPAPETGARKPASVSSLLATTALTSHSLLQALLLKRTTCDFEVVRIHFQPPKPRIL